MFSTSPSLSLSPSLLSRCRELSSVFGRLVGRRIDRRRGVQFGRMIDAASVSQSAAERTKAPACLFSPPALQRQLAPPMPLPPPPAFSGSFGRGLRLMNGDVFAEQLLLARRPETGACACGLRLRRTRRRRRELFLRGFGPTCILKFST